MEVSGIDTHSVGKNPIQDWRASKQGFFLEGCD